MHSMFEATTISLLVTRAAQEALKTKSKHELVLREWGPRGLASKIQTGIIKAVGPQRP